MRSKSIIKNGCLYQLYLSDKVANVQPSGAVVGEREGEGKERGGEREIDSGPFSGSLFLVSYFLLGEEKRKGGRPPHPEGHFDI